MRWFAVAAAAEALAPSSIYVHLPFCRRRCFYCDFPVVVSGDGAATDARAAAYGDRAEILPGGPGFARSLKRTTPTL